ncbi:hypothetical protein [Pengzhenrongella sicca]|uniref:Uncharacterized protein n=1 Tax=Pengzhenrongella sicca TaxID=2819238 RepID=A0A8A4ZFX1_9MICO|nr:hypothetical protein [Pengzhenrongella sicca]QTE30185.1 hypothetical protein J4E96_03995 [Pengzhenrongella sicca]
MTVDVVESRAAIAERAPAPVVVALLDGSRDDAEVVDVALATCTRRRAGLRVVYVCADRELTPLAVAYARAYADGAMRVTRLVPGVVATAVCLTAGTAHELRRELADAQLVVAAADRAAELAAVATAADGEGRVVRGVRSASDGSRLRLGYRLALQRELERDRCRPDGSSTPEELDDAWHVGVAYPPLRRETIEAWVACSAWPPRAAGAGPGTGIR